MDPLSAQDFARARRRRRTRQIAGLLLRRVLLGLVLLVLVSAGLFLLAEASPFDPLVGYLGDRYPFTSDAQRANLAEALQLNQPWSVAWIHWARGLLHGDLGHSHSHAMPVAQLVGQRLPWTLLLSSVALGLAVVMGLVGGLGSALRPGSWLDRAASGLAVVAQSVPPFVLALGAIVLGSLTLGWFPAGGAAPASGPVDALTIARHLALPALVLAISQSPWLLLAVRAEAVTALRSDAVRSAVSRGLPWRQVVRGHVWPVAMAPLVTLVGARLPELVVGAVLVEEVFAWPGLAAAMVTSARTLDMSLLAFLTVASAALVLLGSLLADVGYLLLDPRVGDD
ncbi:ABC transporter permease [Luteococcus sp. OSA5]|uniref:ABC transporter permease n=1 Tax=Luteococcus sp. OSA5 TaxID=3401630 RepID=UPI003B43B037